MDRNILKSVIIDQRDLKWNLQLMEREIPESLIVSDMIVVITGVRRCGKSTLLQQIRHTLTDKDYFLNFDDDRLIQFCVDDFQVLLEIFIELFGQQKTFYFDEIQNVRGWERFVRRLNDYGNKIFITGSNANMLSRELGTHLTGRYIPFEIYPFSFKEYLSFKGHAISETDIHSTEKRAEMTRYFNHYSEEGGFPQYIRTGDNHYLKSLYESILYRDIMVRNNLTNEREILELVYYLAGNVSNLSSYNSLAKTVGISNATTIRNYLAYFRNSYLVFPVSKFDFSLKKQIQNPKKMYFIDPALVGQLSFRFSENRGRQLENLVFLELKREGKEIFYHRQSAECDFVIKESRHIIRAIQVSLSLYDKGTYARELKGLSESMEHYGLKEGLIITENEEGTDQLPGGKITIKPAWKWFLGY